jgi:nitronate monooxygenase
MQGSGDVRTSWRSSRVARLLGIVYPIIQAPFGGLPSQRLTATVSNLGGMGSLGAVTLGDSAIREVIGEIRSLTSKPFAVNLWVSTSDREASRISRDVIEEKIRTLTRYYSELGIEPPSGIEAKPQNFETQVRGAIDAGVPVLSFIYGIPPSEILEECRRKGIRTIGTATTPEEAVALEEAGLDVIVASGFEGGGHRGSFLQSPADSLMGSLALIPQVADAVQAPVVAAGGIADGRGLTAALALGAEAVQIGTAFLACATSGASKAYRDALLSPSAKLTALTDTLTGRLARGLRTHLVDLLRHGSDPLSFPAQHGLVQTLAGPASAQERTDLMIIWAGQSVSLCKHTDASELMAELIATANEFFPLSALTPAAIEWKCAIHGVSVCSTPSFPSVETGVEGDSGQNRDE